MTDLEQRLAKLQKQFHGLRIMGGEGVNVHGSMRTGYAVEVKAGVAQSGTTGGGGGGDVPGCTDPGACNFNSSATVDDASCTYGGACCVGADCSISCEADCAGVYQGDGTDCDPNPCLCASCPSPNITATITPSGYVLERGECDISPEQLYLDTTPQVLFTISGPVNIPLTNPDSDAAQCCFEFGQDPLTVPFYLQFGIVQECNEANETTTTISGRMFLEEGAWCGWSSEASVLVFDVSGTHDDVSCSASFSGCTGTITFNCDTWSFGGLAPCQFTVEFVIS